MSPLFTERPAPPLEGETLEIGGLFVSRRTCSCCKDAKPRYFARDGAGQVVSMCFGDEGWTRMAHVLGWFPMDGMTLEERLPKKASAKAAEEQAESNSATTANRSCADVVLSTTASSPSAADADSCSTNSAKAGDGRGAGPGRPDPIDEGSNPSPCPLSPSPADAVPRKAEQLGLF